MVVPTANQQAEQSNVRGGRGETREQQGAGCGCQNATCSARRVENSVVF